MKDQILDLFDPETAVMDPDYSPTSAPPHPDFGFAFNDSNFSDRLLRIEVVADSSDACSDSDASQTLADWTRHRKQRGGDFKENDTCHSFSALDISTYQEEQIVNCNQIDTEDADNGNQDEAVVAMIEEAQSGTL